MTESLWTDQELTIIRLMGARIDQYEDTYNEAVTFVLMNVKGTTIPEIMNTYALYNEVS